MPVLAGGCVVAGAGVAYGLRKMQNEDVPKTAVLTAAFFVGSLVHIPMPPASVHLLLPGLMGLMLGWSIYPAVLVGLLLQYVMFGHGGITTLGINTVIIATPGLICHLLLKRHVGATARATFNAGVIAGLFGVVLTCILFVTALYVGGKHFAGVAGFCLYSHIPMIVIEAVISGYTLSFLYRVRPRSLPQYQPLAEGSVQ